MNAYLVVVHDGVNASPPHYNITLSICISISIYKACTLLSSMTVFMDSIHTASMSPSSTTHLYVWYS